MKAGVGAGRRDNVGLTIGAGQALGDSNMPTTPLQRIAALLCLCGLPGLICAQDAFELEPLCLQCHRAEGATAVTPHIEGQHAEYLAVQLQRFAERHREGFPMTALSEGLDSAAIARISADLAARPWPKPQTLGSAEQAGFGREQLAALDCAACHGADYRGAGSLPRIAGQRQAYLARQIAGFGQGDRHHPPVGGGMRMYRLQEAEIEALAAALAALD